MTLGKQHVFTDVDLTREEVKKLGISDYYMPPFRLVCSCGWQSNSIRRGCGEWEQRHTYRIEHLLESVPLDFITSTI